MATVVEDLDGFDNLFDQLCGEYGRSRTFSGYTCFHATVSEVTGAGDPAIDSKISQGNDANDPHLTILFRTTDLNFSSIVQLSSTRDW